MKALILTLVLLSGFNASAEICAQSEAQPDIRMTVAEPMRHPPYDCIGACRNSFNSCWQWAGGDSAQETRCQKEFAICKFDCQTWL